MLIGWFLFRIPDLPTAQVFVEGLTSHWAAPGMEETRMIVALLAFFALHGLSARYDLKEKFTAVHPALQGCAIASALFLIFCASNTTQEFIYFQF